MDFEDLFKEENKSLCRYLGITFLVLPLLYILAGGFVRTDGIHGWFGEWFLLGLAVLFLLGIFLSVYGFSKQKKEKD